MRPRRVAAALLVLVAAGAGAAVVVPAGADPARSTATERPAELQMLGLINNYRKSIGSPPVQVVPQLVGAAQWYAQDMADNDSFSHTHIDTLGRDIGERYLAFGYRIPAPLAEASLQGFTSPEAAFTSFRNSPAHDRIMRDPRMHAIGIGVATEPGIGTFWVASFGPKVNPRPARPGEEKKPALARSAKKRAAKARAARRARARKARARKARAARGERAQSRARTARAGESAHNAQRR
jgi:uncharacterized protein YkwD